MDARSTEDDVRVGWRLRDHVPLDEVVVHGHRGAGDLAPENTLAAFRLAWSLGTIPEADVRQTRDGVIVAFHDEDLGRAVRGIPLDERGWRIADLSWAEVAALDVGSWRGEAFADERIPRFDAVTAALREDPARRLYADSKAIDLAALAAEARRAGVEHQLILAAPEHRVLRTWLDLAPRSATLLWMGGTEADLSRRLVELRETSFAAVTQLQVHVRVVDGALAPSAGFLAGVGTELRERDILFQVLPWGITDPVVLRRLLDLGVASFATDRPDVVRATLRAYYASPADDQDAGARAGRPDGAPTGGTPAREWTR